MKKIFTLVVAALAAVTMSAEVVQEDISVVADDWGWGWNSSASNAADGKLIGEITGGWGAISMGWNENIDMSQWDKLIIVVDKIEGEAGDYWRLKALIRDADYVQPAEGDGIQLEGYVGLETNPDEQNYLVIDLKEEKTGFDVSKVHVLAVQAEKVGAKFTISRAFLQKGEDEEPTEAVENISVRNNGIRYNLLGQEVGEDYKGIVIMNGKKMIVR